MIIKELTREDILQIGAWSSHASIKKRIFIDDWDKYFTFVYSCDHYFLFGVWEFETLIGQISAEIIESYISISLMIKPQLQGKGIGVRVLNFFRNSVNNLTSFTPEFIEAAIESDNIASIKCFEKAGFIKTGKDSDGNLLYKAYKK